MPLLRIDASSAHPAADLVAVGDSVHRAMVETLGAPAESKFQVLTPHAARELNVTPFGGLHHRYSWRAAA